jgi:adenylylsulfate kinase-like enzyme
MIYFFTGKSKTGKSTLGKLLADFLRTERRNWRKSVFHIDENSITDIYPFKFRNNIELTNYIISFAKFIHLNDCDVVISSTSYNRESRELFKRELNDLLIEFYLYNINNTDSNEYEPSTHPHIRIDTTKSTPIQSFSFIITELNSIKKI